MLDANILTLNLWMVNSPECNPSSLRMHPQAKLSYVSIEQRNLFMLQYISWPHFGQKNIPVLATEETAWSTTIKYTSTENAVLSCVFII